MSATPEQERVREVLRKARIALEDGRITKQEHDALVRHYRKADPTPASSMTAAPARASRFSQATQAALLIGGAIIVLALAVILSLKGGDLTGAVVLNASSGDMSNGSAGIDTPIFADNTTIVSLELIGVTAMRISGTAEGDGNIVVLLRENDRTHMLYEYRNGIVRTAHASLPKSRYIEGELVTYEALNVSSAYLMTEQEALPLDNSTIPNLTAGDYTIKLIINDTELSQEALPFTVMAEAILAREEFDTCGTLCSTDLSGNATLEIIIEGNATVRIDNISIRTQENRPPALASQIPDAAGTAPVRIRLSDHFNDPDGDELLYDTTRHDGLNETIANGTLIIDGPPGRYSYIAYASDLKELIQSNQFTVEITSITINGSDANESNAMANATDDINETNATQGDSTNTTTPVPVDIGADGAANLTNTTLQLSCDDPNPNLRPVDCLNLDGGRYFDEQLYWENTERARVAKFTKIGNLLIKGVVIEHDTTGTPGPADFAIGYNDEDFNPVSTIWIDASGNLHLRGELHEENENLLPIPNTRAFINRRGVYMAYADQHRGDLYVRGNVIESREGIDG